MSLEPAKMESLKDKHAALEVPVASVQNTAVEEPIVEDLTT